MNGPLKRIDLKVAFGCNNMCVFCVQGKKREKHQPKPLAQLRGELKRGYEDGGRELVLTGGEPTLHGEFLRVVREAKKIGYRNIQIQSNGRMFRYPEFCRAAAAAGATEASPALHGSRAEIHDYLTGAAGSFKETVTGIMNLKKAGFRVITNTVVTKPNTQDLPAIAALLAKLGVDQFQFAFVHILGSAAANAKWLVPKKTVIEPFVKHGLDIGLAAGLRVMTEAIPYCFMGGYEEYVAETIIPRTKIFDAGTVIEDFGKYRLNEGKAKGPKCPSCAFFGRCEGPWREYPELFGWGEFVPCRPAAPAAAPKRRKRGG
ncbi:MAG: radical SAM protein [Elusimicrobia bacterium]|nr:radical SAM protein [Elusimicrobiota bacterium]